jgi:putative hemolysin
LSAFFSGSESAFFSLSAAEVARLEATGGRRGRRAAALVRRSHDLLSALLIGNLLVNTAASVVATGLCLAWFGAQGVAVAIPAVTLLLLLFGEITPKLLALGSDANRWPWRRSGRSGSGCWRRVRRCG